MKKTKERRVLALIMAALMVLSVLLPGSGMTVRYMAEAVPESFTPVSGE